MPKLGMEPIRKQQVIDSTMTCIYEDGIAKATLQRVAKGAGITPGLILHYFTDKDGLFEAVYRDLYRRLAEETSRRLKRSKTATERVFAILESQVCDEMIEPRVVATWFALGARASESEVLARMEQINSKRLVSNLVHVLKEVGVSEKNAKEIADELLAMIYGLWTNLAHTTFSKPQHVRAILNRYLVARVPQLHEG